VAVSGEADMMQLFGGLIRIPDVAFVSWDRLPTATIPTERLPEPVPDRAAEVLSPTNTAAEMRRKLREYFRAGVRLAWIVDPEPRTVAVYTSAKKPDVVLTPKQTLDGGDVLPGFRLPLRKLFAELDRKGPSRRRK
jgi:Uma2 family endonuclease